LKKIGVTSQMLVVKRRSADADVTECRTDRSLCGRLSRKARRIVQEAPLRRFAGYDPDGFRRFSTERSWYGDELLRDLPGCDVINLHWIAGMFDVSALFRLLPVHLPVVWTLHDMNPLTGGCHYDQGCGKFVENCGRCPQLVSDREGDPSRTALRNKRRAFAEVSEDRFCLVAPSEWLASCARASSLFRRFAVESIPYGIDTLDFAPRDQRWAREVLGIQFEGPVLLFVASTVNDPRKGFRQLKEAVEKTDAPVFLLSVGGGVYERTERSLHLGNVGADSLLSLVYSCADVFVITSLQDNLPLTVLEAMACGTPVIGFGTGGIPDAVQDGVAGRTVPIGDVPALALAIAEVVQNPEHWRGLRVQCRNVVMERYTLEQQAHSYARKYRELIDRC